MRTDSLNDGSIAEAPATTGKRLLLLAVAGLVSAAAALAIGILLFGDFGETEGRILGTTALLAGYGLLSLPAAILRDRRRLPALAALLVVLAVAAAALTITAIWVGDVPEALGKAIGTLDAWLVATVQVAALALRLAAKDARSVRRLFAASSVLVVVLAALLTVVLWAELDSEAFARAFGALLVLDLLLVVLQPILARARPVTGLYDVRVLVAPAGELELRLEASDLAAAAAEAVRTAERKGHRVLRLELAATGTGNGGRPRGLERTDAAGARPA